MKKIIIVGGGLSGLACAFYALKNGFHVELHEKSDRLGGMLQSINTPYGSVEKSANGFLNSARVEDLFKNLGVELEPSSTESRRRYIFLKKPQRWPLSFKGTLSLLKAVFTFKLNKKRVQPDQGESVMAWISRVGSPELADHFVSPGLQGVYGTTSDHLSAQMIWDSIHAKSPAPNGPRGTVRPKGGFGVFHSAFLNWFKEKPITIYFGSEYQLPKNVEFPTIVCTEAWTAAKLVGFPTPNVQGLTTVSMFFQPEEKKLPGYGVLFPKGEGFNSMGVLFEHQIFSDTPKFHLERWILQDSPELIGRQWLGKAIQDRMKLYGSESARPLHVEVVRWPTALPIYDSQLKQILDGLKLPKNLYLCGNYLGGIGLAKLLDRAKLTIDQLVLNGK